MTPTFRVEAAQMRRWHAEAAQRIGLRGVAAVAKELEAAAAKADAEGMVTVTRHQVFTWAEALQGAVTRDATAAGALAQVVAEMRNVLAGRAPAPAQAPAPAAAPTSEPPAPATGPLGRGLGEALASSALPPPVIYTRSQAPGAGPAPAHASAQALVSGAALGEEVRRLIASAQHEVCVIAPWGYGVDSLLDALVAAPAGARVLLVSRRPEREDEAFHRGMAQLSRRGAITAFSPLLQTRMVVVDGERALVGAASIPVQGGPSREAAVRVEGAAAKAAREHFARVFTEAGGSTA